MANVVKGTFPVRFRIDGKDGTNTWLKYAETLDLTDTSSGKQYPSVMYDEPTSKCVYIGIGKGTGDEPTSGQYYQWTKYVGDDGTSFTPKGSAVAHYTSESAYNSATKTTGYYLVDASPSALLKYWNGSATVANDSEDGDGYTTSDKHLWVKDGEKWNDLGDIQGPKGDKTYLHYITVDSYSYSSSGNKLAIIRKQIESGVSNTIGGTTSRGLTIWEISKTGTAISRYGTYNTYGDTTAADRMAQAIENGIVQDEYFLAITSYDGCGFSANLIAALKKWGGSDIADYTPKRQAFSFLGYKGMPEGTAQQVLNIGEGKQASIYSLVNNGICQGKGQDGRSIVSITNLYQKSSSDENAPSSWFSTSPALDNTDKYLWRKQTIKYTYGSDYVDIQVVGKIGDKGIDGNGVDYAFCRTTTYTTPTKPSVTTPISSDTTVGSYVWTDDPKGVNSSYPYEWVSEMKQVNGIWQGYGTPTLWANYSKDGNSISGVSNKYLANSSPSTPSISGNTWYDSPSQTGFSADKKYLWNYETVTYSQTTATSTTPRIIAVWGEKGNTGKGVSSIVEYYLATSASSGVTTGTSGWTTTIQSMTSTNKYLWNYETINWTEGNPTNSTPCIIGVYGDKGNPGNPGADAYSYKLTSQISALPLNNDGSPSITSFKLKAYIYKGAVSQTVTSSYKLRYEIWRVGDTQSNIYGEGGNGGELTVSVSSSYTDIVRISCYFKNSSGTVLDSFDILPVKAGAAGVSYFPNMRGYWESGQTYYWTGMSRDMVTYNISGKPYLFAVKTAGTSTTNCPVKSDGVTTNEGWEKADSPFSMLFANFVYTNNASVAGFVWAEEQMMSSSYTGSSLSANTANIYMNGKDGVFRALKAEIKGKIIAESGTFENVEISNSCQILQKNDKGWFLLGANAQSDRPESWWLGYRGESAGQFSMDVYNASNTSMKSSLYIKADPPSSTTTYSNGILRINSIYQTLADFNQDGGMNIKIGYNKGEGVRFTLNTSSNAYQAFVGSGHGCLNGVVQGYRLNTVSSGVIPIANGNTVYCSGNSTSLYLPKLSDCKAVLGTTGAFALDLCIIGASGASNFRVYGSGSSAQTDCKLVGNDFQVWYATMSAGDVLRLKLIFNGSSFLAFVVSHFN